MRGMKLSNTFKLYTFWVRMISKILSKTLVIQFNLNLMLICCLKSNHSLASIVLNKCAICKWLSINFQLRLSLFWHSHLIKRFNCLLLLIKNNNNNNDDNNDDDDNDRQTNKQNLALVFSLSYQYLAFNSLSCFYPL